MKRIIGMLLVLTILLTGCTEVTNEIVKNESSNKETLNLVVQDEVIKTETEEEFVTYIDSINYQVETLTLKEENLTIEEQKTLENTFITLTDFIFYNGEINGKTFNELTTEAKQQVLSIYEKIDQKIESKVPGYKEKISEHTTRTYENISIKIQEAKDKIKDKYIEDYGQDRYDQVEKSYEESKEALKEATKETYEVIIDVTKDFYEENKNKAENWYKNYKESRN